MAEPTAQQLARQKLANTDLAKFAPPPPKRKKAEPEQPKYTKQTVKMSAEERKAKQKAYAHAYYIAHKDERQGYPFCPCSLDDWLVKKSRVRGTRLR